jgi:heterodisulfide reductase subunit B
VKYAYFPGCSLESTAWDFDRSARAVCRALGIELEEIPDWVCCGSTPAHGTNPALAVALPVLNLQKAEAMGRPVLTACASCYARLRTANHQVNSAPEERRRAEFVTGKPYGGQVAVHHLLDVLANHLGLEAIREKVKRPLTRLRVACYYGCLLTRPPEITAFDNPENPTAMDDLVAAAGGEPVRWPMKTECCGAGLSITHGGVVARLGRRLVAMARRAGADCISVACPLCQLNLDLRQSGGAAGDEHLKGATAGSSSSAQNTVGQANRGTRAPLPPTPVLYVTQLLGLALGLSADDLGLSALLVNADHLFARSCCACGPSAHAGACQTPAHAGACQTPAHAGARGDA